MPPNRCGNCDSLPASRSTVEGEEGGEVGTITAEAAEVAVEAMVAVATEEDEPRTLDRDEERDDDRRRDVLTLGTYSDMLQRKAATTVA